MSDDQIQWLIKRIIKRIPKGEEATRRWRWAVKFHYALASAPRRWCPADWLSRQFHPHLGSVSQAAMAAKMAAAVGVIPAPEIWSRLGVQLVVLLADIPRGCRIRIYREAGVSAVDALVWETGDLPAEPFLDNFPVPYLPSLLAQVSL